MKLLYVTHEKELNGASKSLLNLIEVFQNKYDIYVLAIGEGEFTEKLKEYNCKIIIQKYYLDCEERSTHKKIIWFLKKIRYLFYRMHINKMTARKISKIVKSEGIDLIHTNSSSTFMGAYISILSNIPHIWHFREFLWEDFKMYPVLGWDYFYNIVEISTKKVICVSNSVLNKYKGVIHTDLTKVYNGVSGEIHNKLYHNKNSFDILQSGIISEIKGVDTSIEAIGILLSQGFDNIHLYLAGKGYPDFSEIYNQREDVKEHVHVLGYVNNLQKLREDKMDVELICSRSEAFGRVTIEAMQAGLVVIGANTAGTSELITDNENGLLFNCGSAEDLAEKIKCVYENKIDSVKLGKNAQTTANKFSIVNCAQQIEIIYESLC